MFATHHRSWCGVSDEIRMLSAARVNHYGQTHHDHRRIIENRLFSPRAREVLALLWKSLWSSISSAFECR
jgi:hypothetical protein